MLGPDKDFLQTLFGNTESTVMQKTAAAAEDEEVTEAMDLLYKEAYELIVKTASEEARAAGKVFDPKSLTEEVLNDLLPAAVQEVLTKSAATDEEALLNKVAEARETFNMAIDFGRFIGQRIAREQTGFIAKTASLLFKAEATPERIAHKVLATYGIDKKASVKWEAGKLIAEKALGEGAHAIAAGTELSPTVAHHVVAAKNLGYRPSKSIPGTWRKAYFGDKVLDIMHEHPVGTTSVAAGVGAFGGAALKRD